MATAQMVRTEETTGTWASMFPVEQVTEQQSALFAKKLLAVAISNITYLRAIFPERAYGDRCLGDLNLKILRDDSSCPGASQVIKWVKGCFDALDKKYLRTLIIGIYVDPENPHTVIESYTFKFSYSTQCGVDIFRNGKKITSANSTEETRKATIRMLHTIIVLTQTMDALPDNVMMTMKILYYDEVTPPDYEPPGFKASNVDAFQYDEDVVNVKLGDVSTPFHSLKMRIKTKKTQFDCGDGAEDQPVTDATICNGGLDNDQEGEADQGKMPAVQQTEEIHDNTKLADSLKEAEIPKDSPGKPETGKATKVGTPNTPKDEEFKVQCPCGCNEDDGLMIVCDVCSSWQHAVCFRILDEEHAPEEHVCDVCAKADSKKKPTDPYLKEQDAYAVQATCLWRRCLVACLEFGRVLPHQLVNRLGVDNNVAQGLLRRLEDEGFVLTPNKGRRLGKVVNKEKIQKEGIPAYFKDKQKPEQQKQNGAGDQEATPMEVSENDDPESKKSGKSKSSSVEATADVNTKMSQVIDQAANISLDAQQLRSSCRKKSGLSFLKDKRTNSENTEKMDSAKSKRGQKRVFSKVDHAEFDLSNSQETHDTRSSRRKKCSDVHKSIMV